MDGLCEYPGCRALSTVETHAQIAGVPHMRYLCAAHAHSEGFCIFCGEQRADRDPESGLCADCLAEGITNDD